MIDWLRLVLSIFNIVVLLWLGLTVLLNADRRNWGVWLVVGVIMLSALFFISHTALMVDGISLYTSTTTLWLALGMAPLVVLPISWYIGMLWYGGYWVSTTSDFRRRNRRRLIGLILLMTTGLTGLAILGLPFISALATINTLFFPLRMLIIMPIGRIPLVVLVYPVYVLLCILLSLDVLHRPGPVSRVMGDLARQRARPWLVATSLLLLVVGILMTWVIFWTVTNTKSGGRYVLGLNALEIIGRFDLVLMLFVTAAVLSLGQAIVSYELFTGQSLPRQGLARHWYRAIGLGLGYGVLISSAVALTLKPIYTTLLTATLMTTFFALLGRLTFVERERYIAHLRPFVASQRLFDVLLAGQSDSADWRGPTHPLQSLCVDVLDARLAYLIALGPLTPLVAAQSYSESEVVVIPTVYDLTNRFENPDNQFVAVQSEHYGGAIWAIPLKSENRLVGVLLLGGKRSGGLYTQEEMSIAQATGERLLDMQASATLAQRLVILQRQRMAQSQVVDQRARRILHDEVLPLLHTAMLIVNGDSNENDTNPVTAEILLADAHAEIAKLLRELPPTMTPDVVRLGLIGALRRVVDSEYHNAFDTVEWRVDDGVEEQAKKLGSLSAETTFYAAREMVRNAAKYARKPNDTLSLTIAATTTADSNLTLTLTDNGPGIDAWPKGTGQGLELHSTLMAVIGGSLAIDSVHRQHTCITLTTPIQPRV